MGEIVNACRPAPVLTGESRILPVHRIYHRGRLLAGEDSPAALELGDNLRNLRLRSRPVRAASRDSREAGAWDSASALLLRIEVSGHNKPHNSEREK